MRNYSFLLVGIELIAATLFATLVLVYKGNAAGESFFWGALAAVANAVILLLQMKKKMKCDDAHHVLRFMYRSGMERFFVVMLLLAAGMKLMGLQPLPLVAGFVLGQVTHIVTQMALNRIEI